MTSDFLAHVGKYYGVYQFVAAQPRTDEEMKNYMKETQKMCDTNAKTFLREVKNGKNGLVVKKDEMYVINPIKAQVLLDELLDVLNLPKDDETISKIAKENDRLLEDNSNLKQDLAKVSERNERLEEEIRIRVENETMEKEARREFVYQSVEQKTLLTESVRSCPPPSVTDSIFLENMNVLIDPHDGIGERYFYKEETDASKELTEENYHRRSFFRSIRDVLLWRRMKDNQLLKDEKPGSELFKEYKESRKRTIQSIVDNPNMTNQEKLAMYAFVSEHRGKDMENLLNFAGDNNVNANFVIELLENRGPACSYENIRDLLRQMQKPSEFKQRQDFAKELIQGKWYITADYNGKATKFQLVPVDELNELRAVVGLSEVKFKPNAEEDADTKEVADDYVSTNDVPEGQTPIESSEVKHHDVSENMKVDPPDYEAEEPEEEKEK